MADSRGEITRLVEFLKSREGGDPAAEARLERLVYAELKKIAANRLWHERRGHTLTPTDLVNEAWLKLEKEWNEYIEDRAYLRSAASLAMFRLLVDHARARKAQKREHVRVPEAVEDLPIASPEEDERMIALWEALERLEKIRPRAARVVQLRYIAGYTADEVAAQLGVTRQTVTRDWRFAKAWLYEDEDLKREVRSPVDRILDKISHQSPSGPGDGQTG